MITQTKDRQPIKFWWREDSKANEIRLILHLMSNKLLVHVRKQIMGSMTGKIPFIVWEEYGMVQLFPGNEALSAGWYGLEQGEGGWVFVHLSQSDDPLAQCR